MNVLQNLLGGENVATGNSRSDAPNMCQAKFDEITASCCTPFFVMEWLEEFDWRDIGIERKLIASNIHSAFYAEKRKTDEEANLNPCGRRESSHLGKENSAVQITFRGSAEVGVEKSADTSARSGGNILDENGEIIGHELNAKGVHFAKKGEWDEALKYWIRALQIRKSILEMESSRMRTTYDGSDDEKKVTKKVCSKTEDVAHTLNNIGIAYGKLDQFEDAMECLAEALDMRRAKFGKYHASNAATLHNMGNVLQKAGDHEDAIKCFKDAKRIKEKLLGKNHPDVALAINAIGHVYYEIQEYDMAYEKYKDALNVYAKAGISCDHPDVAQTLLDIADVENVFAANIDRDNSQESSSAIR